MKFGHEFRVQIQTSSQDSAKEREDTPRGAFHSNEIHSFMLNLAG